MAAQKLVSIVVFTVPAGSYADYPHDLMSAGQPVTPTIITPQTTLGTCVITGVDNTRIYVDNSAGVSDVLLTLRCVCELAAQTEPGTPTFVQQQAVPPPLPESTPTVIDFTTPGTFSWPIPAAARFVKIIAIGGGGGGSSGESGDNTALRRAGNGGGGGGLSMITYSANELRAKSNPLCIIVGSGGAGGASVKKTGAGVTTGTAGVSGTRTRVTSVDQSSPGSLYNFVAAGGGISGNAASTFSGLGGTGWTAGSNGVATDAFVTSPGPTGIGFIDAPSPGGGGKGGNLSAAVAGAGYNGTSTMYGGLGGVAGLVGSQPINGAAGSSYGAHLPILCGGGGGGGGAALAADAGTGGAGASPGGGGAGGGAARNGYFSGAGGRGGDGMVRLIWW